MISCFRIPWKLKLKIFFSLLCNGPAHGSTNPSSTSSFIYQHIYAVLDQLCFLQLKLLNLSMLLSVIKVFTAINKHPLMTLPWHSHRETTFAIFLVVATFFQANFMQFGGRILRTSLPWIGLQLGQVQHIWLQQMLHPPVISDFDHQRSHMLVCYIVAALLCNTYLTCAVARAMQVRQRCYDHSVRH